MLTHWREYHEGDRLTLGKVTCSSSGCEEQKGQVKTYLTTPRPERRDETDDAYGGTQILHAFHFIGEPMAVDVNLDYVRDIESSGGTDPRRLRPNRAGALGDYQITKIAFKDLQLHMPDKYANKSFEEVVLNPEIAREAARDYFLVLEGYLTTWGIPVTQEHLVAAYNMGPMAFKQHYFGKRRMPTQTKNYIRRYNALRGRAQ